MKRLFVFLLAMFALAGCNTFKVTPVRSTIDLGFARQDSTCNATLVIAGQSISHQVPGFFCDLPGLAGLRLRYHLNLSTDSVRIDSTEILFPAVTGGK